MSENQPTGSASPTDCRRYQHKVAIVTGAASGIGAAVAARLVAEGAAVLAVDNNGEALHAVVAGITAARDEAGDESGRVAIRALVQDVSTEAGAAAIVAAAKEHFGRVDLLAHMAGILRAVRTEEMTLDLWNQVIGVNLTGTFLITRAAIGELVATRGAIVLAASIASVAAHPWMVAYAASKGGVAAMTGSLSIEYLDRGVRVNAVAPGGVSTGMTAALELPADLGREDLRHLGRIRPPKEFGEPADVAALVAFLGSDDARYITGEIVRIDGGTLA